MEQNNKKLKKIAILLAIGSIIQSCKCKEVVTQCTIVSHATSSDRYGDIDYHSPSVCKDGYSRDLQGLRYYILPQGTTVDYTHREIE